MTSGPSLRRVRLRNYKSVRECDVELGRFTILVGRNGSGKSNFLDALAFISDALQASITHAAKKRDWMPSVTHRSAQGEAADIDFVVDLDLDDGRQAEYGLSLADEGKLPAVRREWLFTFTSGGTRQKVFESQGRDISSDVLDLRGFRPPAGLALPLFTGNDSARCVFDTLRQVRVYDPQPQRMRGRVPVNAAALDSDGSNAASVTSRLQEADQEQTDRLEHFLSAAIDDSAAINVRAMGAPDADGLKEARLVFYFDRDGVTGSFDNRAVSDGTLRAVAVLLAAMQRQPDGKPIPVIGIEEPEVGLHPAASGAVMEALREASLSTQVLMTTHSPDILDQVDIENDMLLVVRNGRDGTRIGPPGEANLSIIRDHLYSAGDLLRMDQLEPLPPAAEEQAAEVAEK